MGVNGGIGRMRKVIYLVEGENEKVIVDAIKGKYIIAGKVNRFNCLEKNVSNLIRSMNQTECVIVLDTDVLNDAQLKCLGNNLKVFHKRGIKVVLITQDNNLEDELVRSLDITSILNMYDVESLAKHKRRVNKERDMLRKLESLNFNFEQFWNSDKLKLDNVKLGKAPISK